MIYYVIINELKYPFPDLHWAQYFARIKRKEGFKVNYPHEELLNLYYSDPSYQGYGYVVITQDIFKSRQRIKEKINKIPEYYTWTKRTKPRWITNKHVSIVGDKL